MKNGLIEARFLFAPSGLARREAVLFEFMHCCSDVGRAAVFACQTTERGCFFLVDGGVQIRGLGRTAFAVKRLRHELRILGRDSKKRERWPIRSSTSLFPVSQSGNTDADHEGEFWLRRF